MTLFDASRPFNGTNFEPFLFETETREPTGWISSTNMTVTYTDLTGGVGPTGTVAIAYSGDCVYYANGVRILKKNGDSDSVVIANTEGIHFVYYDVLTGTLSETTVINEALIKNQILVTLVYRDATGQTFLIKGYERHGARMDGDTHWNLHNSIGTVYVSGLALSGILADQSGALDTHAQCAVENGVIRDEDITITIANGTPQTLTPTASISVFYKSGASGVWRKQTASTFPVRASAPGARLAYNQFTGGVWTQTAASANGRFILAHIVATNDVVEPIVAIQGQAQYAGITAAREGANVEVNNLILSGLPTAEWQFIGTLIYETSTAYANTIKARIRTTDLGTTYVDWRTARLESSGRVTNHSDLANLSRHDHLAYPYLETGDSYGTAKDGVGDASVGINAALTAIGALERSLYLPPGTYLLGSNVTIPANVTLWLAEGAVISDGGTAGRTLTINGTFKAGDVQCFSFSGVGSAINFAQKFVELATVKTCWFGDDETALQQALNSVDYDPGHGSTVQLCNSMTITSTIKIPEKVHLFGKDSRIYTNGVVLTFTGDGACLQTKNDDTSDPSDAVKLSDFRVVKDAGNANTQVYGIKMTRAKAGEFRNISVSGFEALGDIGFVLDSQDDAATNNRFWNCEFRANATGFALYGTTDKSNETKFFGCWFVLNHCPSTQYQGAGLFIERGTDVLLDGCIIQGNYGYGIVCCDESPTLVACLLENNGRDWVPAGNQRHVWIPLAYLCQVTVTSGSPPIAETSVSITGGITADLNEYRQGDILIMRITNVSGGTPAVGNTITGAGWTADIDAIATSSGYGAHFIGGNWSTPAASGTYAIVNEPTYKLTRLTYGVDFILPEDIRSDLASTTRMTMPLSNQAAANDWYIYDENSSQYVVHFDKSADYVKSQKEWSVQTLLETLGAGTNYLGGTSLGSGTAILPHAAYTLATSRTCELPLAVAGLVYDIKIPANTTSVATVNVRSGSADVVRVKGKTTSTTVAVFGAGTIGTFTCNYDGYWDYSSTACFSGRVNTNQDVTGTVNETDFGAGVTFPRYYNNNYRVTRIIAAGTKTGVAGTKTIKFYYASQSVTVLPAVNDEVDWVFEADIVEYTTTSHRCMWRLMSATLQSGYVVLTPNSDSADITVKLTGQLSNAGDTLTMGMFSSEHLT